MEKMHKKNIQLFALSYFVAIISLTGFYFFQDDTSEKVQETMESLIERTTTTTTYISNTTTTTLGNPELAFENFKNYWNDNLKEERPLSESDFSKTREFLNNNHVFYISIKERETCIKRTRGTVTTGVIDENHPYEYNNWTNTGWWMPETYSCGEEKLYGNPFFQDGNWWIFKSTDYPEELGTDGLYKKCGYPCSPVSMVRFATRVKIDDFARNSHLGLYSFYDFIEIDKYLTKEITEEEGEYFTLYTQTVGKESGSYYYKEAWFDHPKFVYDDLIQHWCLEDGFTQEECDNTATYEWVNPNIFIGVEFKKDVISCAVEMNQFINEINESYFNFVEGYGYGEPLPRMMRGRQDLKWVIPKLTNEVPTDYMNIIALLYDDGGGTLKYPYLRTYTFDLSTCEQVEMEYAWNVNPATMKGRVLKYAAFPSTSFPDGAEIVDYKFDEDYLFEHVLFTKDTFYTILWDCRLCTDNYLLISNAPENQANPYLVAIPMYVVGNE